jgi:hypothetical protein
VEVCRQLGLDRHRLAGDLDGRIVWQRVRADADSALRAAPAAPRLCSLNGRRHLSGYDQVTWARPWPPPARSEDDGRSVFHLHQLRLAFVAGLEDGH